MKTKFKRFLSTVLSTVLAFSLLPAAVFAEEVETPALPTATVSEITKEDLTFAMNFLVDNATEEQLEYYSEWYADFELTVNKDITFNANDTADGYLAGEYGEYGWVNVPPSDVTLKADEPLKIMEYASELLGEAGLKFTFGEVYTSVKDFNCGVFLDEEFLAENPDVEVKLELKMYNPEDETENYVIGETYTFTPADLKPALPTASVTKVSNKDLTFAMNFTVDEITEEQLEYYKDWYADFELTVNKEVTFNADGSADGYLSGQYDEWSENWVNVPFKDATLAANEPLKIMAYAAESMNEPGLKYTYGEVYEFVKDFDCGVFLEDEFLEANPDIEVTLELKMYNPEDESECYVIGDTYVFTMDSLASELPSATVTEIENDDLTFAMNFLVDEVSAAQLEYYKNWYADFELTINKDVIFNANGGKDGYLSGQYGEYSWINVPPSDVTLTAGEALKIMEYASELLGESGLKYTFGEVYTNVKDFDCGIYFEEEFLAENPDLEVTLELKMYNPADETKCYVIGDTYTFTLPELPTAKATKIHNKDLTFAMNFKMDESTEEQLAYYGDWYADFELTVNKDVTLNADEIADGYLSGQYDGWSLSWVNVPFTDVILKAGESLKIMEYAAGLMGEPGLKYTYKEVYTGVQDFDCGVFFTDEFLATNPDLEVTLELKMYNPANEEICYVIGDTYVFTLDDVMPDLPTATVKDISEEKEDLTFAMNFLVDDVTDEQLEYFKNWYADFELTINKEVTFNADGGANGYLSGEYGSYGWVNVPTSDVTLEANVPLKIMAYAAELLGEKDLKITFNDVYTLVKDFDCGVFFEEDYLAANPDLKVTLELKMYNPEDETENYVIGDTYIFTTESAVAMNTFTGVVYTDVNDAIAEAIEGNTVVLLRDVEDTVVTVFDGITLDLDGYTLTTNYFSSFGHIVDNSEDNEGLLVVPENLILMQNTNKQLPIKNGEGYQFFEVLGFNKAVLNEGARYVFQPLFEEAAHELLLKGAETSGITINVRVSWDASSGRRYQDFVYNDAHVKTVVNSYDATTGKYSQMYTLKLNNTELFKNLSYNVVVIADTGIEFSSN